MARVPGADAVYEVADLFRQRCVNGTASLLWPQHAVWTRENIDRLWRTCFDHEQRGHRDDKVYWEDYIRDQPADLRMIGADLAAVYQLFPGERSNPGEYVRWMLEENYGRTLPDPDPVTFGLLKEAMTHSIGNPGMWYSMKGKESSVWFFAAFAREAKRRNLTIASAGAARTIADETVQRIPRSTQSARNVVLHLLYPDQFEGYASQKVKEQIVAALKSRAGVAEGTDVDEGVLAIRRHLASSLGKDHFNFWDADIKPLWDETNPSPSQSGGTDRGKGKEPWPEQPALAHRAMQEATFLDGDQLADIADLLETRRQLIFEGPPGSGKTYVADKVARWFTGNPLDGETDDRVEVVQFHQSYGYEDFVQGIRPVTTNGALAYEVRDGIFKQLCDRAAERPDERFALLVDEINRGNISRIFGELLLLLEYRDQKARLPYATGPDPYLRIPPNLYLIGTMNTADRSLAQIDYALRRRFYFVRFMPVVDGRAEVLERWLATQPIDDESRAYVLRLFVALNERVRAELTDDYQVGHSYFMQPDIGERSRIDRIWDRAIMPLLEEYFHHHRQRDDLLAGLRPDALVPASPSAEAVGPAPEDAE